MQSKQLATMKIQFITFFSTKLLGGMVRFWHLLKGGRTTPDLVVLHCARWPNDHGTN